MRMDRYDSLVIKPEVVEAVSKLRDIKRTKGKFDYDMEFLNGIKHVNSCIERGDHIAFGRLGLLIRSTIATDICYALRRAGWDVEIKDNSSNGATRSLYISEHRKQ